jgi:ABC-2 type transport system permease protein
VGWCVGIAAYVGLLVAIFPSIEGSPQIDELVESYPDVLKELVGIGQGDITTGAGYLDVELFSFMLPLLVLVLAIGSGARTFAGEEDAGRLELVLSYPVRRRSAVIAKGASIGVEIAIVCVATGLTMALLDPVVGLDLSAIKLVGAMLSVGVVALLFGWLALALGAAIPSRALAIGVPAGAAAAAYLVGGLHGLAGWLDPFRFLSPFWLVGSAPLRSGIDGVGVLVILVSGALLVERRDLETP